MAFVDSSLGPPFDSEIDIFSTTTSPLPSITALTGSASTRVTIISSEPASVTSGQPVFVLTFPSDGITAPATNNGGISSSIPVASITPTTVKNNTSVVQSSSQSSKPSQAISTSTSSSLTASAKIGIGLGVPLGLMIIAIAALAVLFVKRRGRASWSTPRTGLPPAEKDAALSEKRIAANEGGEERGDSTLHDTVASPENILPEKDGINIPPYSRELPGSPGVRRHELPAGKDPP